MTLAVAALQLAGIGNYEACMIVASMSAVKLHFFGSRTPLREKVRGTVNSYRKVWGHRVNLERDLNWMLDVYRWLHRDEMGEQYYQQAREEHYRRIEYARKQYPINDWRRVEPQIAWAREAHEWGKYREGAQWSSSAYDEVVVMQLPEEWKSVYLPWLQRQIARCERQEPPDEASRPVVYKGRLVMLAEALREYRDVAR